MAKAPAPPIAVINVGSFSVKVVTGSYDDNLFQVQAVQTVLNEAQLTSQSSFEDYMGALDVALGQLKEGALKGLRDIHLVLNPSFLMAKIIGMPEFAKGDIGAVMKDRLERDNAVSTKPKGLDDFKTAHVLYDDLKADDKIDDQSDIAVLAVMCERAMIEAMNGLMFKHELVMVGLWSEIVGLAGLMRRHDPQAFTGTVAVINVGHNLTTFQIFNQGRCLFFRPIFTAGMQLTKDVLTITNDDTIDFKQAEELKHRMTLAPEDVDPSTLSPLEALVQNISESAALKEFSLIRKLDISFEYLSANLKRKTNKVYFTGGTANLRGLLHHIKNNTSLPQGELIEVSDKVKILADLSGESAREALLSAGCCLGVIFAIKDGYLNELNLVGKRRGTVDIAAVKTFISDYRNVLAYASEGILALTLCAWLGSTAMGLQKEIATWQTALDGRKERIKKADLIQQKFYDGDVAALQHNFWKARDPLAFYRRVLQQKVDWTSILVALSKGVTPGKIAIQELRWGIPIHDGIAPLEKVDELPVISVNGRAKGNDAVNALSNSLKESGLFKRVDVLRMGQAGKETDFEGLVFEMGLAPK